MVFCILIRHCIEGTDNHNRGSPRNFLCFNRNEGNAQLWPLGLRLAILKTPALANLASPISRAAPYPRHFSMPPTFFTVANT